MVSQICVYTTLIMRFALQTPKEYGIAKINAIRYKDIPYSDKEILLRLEQFRNCQNPSDWFGQVTTNSKWNQNKVDMLTA